MPNGLAVAALLVSALLAGPRAAAASDAGVDHFEAKVRPLLVEHCYDCHSAGANKVKGGLRLDSRSGVLRGGDSGKPAVVPGDPDASPLIRAVRRVDPDTAMPPKAPLTDRQVADLVEWVRAGAPDPRGDTAAAPAVVRTEDRGKGHWAFRPPVAVAPPPVRRADWPRNDVDRFVLVRLEAAGLSPSPEADRRTLIRRASFDLTGLPPSPAEVDAFVADPSPDAYEKLVDRLLASPRYGERWGRHWLDLARYSDSKGYVYDRDERFFVHAHGYRDWVIKALNDDLPYDQFLLRQIAADQIVPASPPGTPGHPDLAAMGFLTIGRRFLGVSQDIIDDRIDVVTRTALGLSVACARCHDHKFDPVPTADYYALYGVFMNGVERTVPLAEPAGDAAAVAAYRAELKRRTDKLDGEFAKRRDRLVDLRRQRAPDYLLASLDADKLPVELFAMVLTETDLNPAVARRWQERFFKLGRSGAFDPVLSPWVALAALSPERFAADAPNALAAMAADRDKPVNPRVAAALAARPPASMRDVAATYGKVLAEADAAWRALVKKDPATKVLPDADQEALRQVLYGPASPMNIPVAAAGTEAEVYFDEPSRVVLAKAQAEVDRLNISSPAAPPHAVILADVAEPRDARVLRRGNPATPGEEVPRRFLGLVAGFGPERKPFTQGSGRLELARAIIDPANPLTARVMVNRVWAHHFGAGLVTTPSDFGTRAEPPSHPELLDFLATRFVADGWSLKRLHREVLLSATYRQASGAVPAARAIDPGNRLLWRQNRSRLDFESTRDALLATTGELDLTAGGRAVELFAPPFSTRRAVYGKIDRQYLPGVLRVFDFANPDLHVPTRPDTTVPQQALFFMNSPFVVGRAKALARRPEVAKAPAPAERVRQMYRLVYQRDPTPGQVAAALAFVTDAAAPPAPPPKPPETAWRYGYGSIDPATGTLDAFHPLPYFTGSAWQGGSNWPDAALGWVQVTAEGGHAGNDLAHAAVRRWVAPRDMTVTVAGTVRHAEQAGDGIRAHLVATRHGRLGTWTLHNQSAATNLGPLDVKAGEAIDFVVDVRETLNSDMFTWAPTITEVGGTAKWDAKKEFGGVPTAPPSPLTAWEAYAQVLLLSNEFLFVD
ncbi:MAG TPA: PSD1 and planctomycete cytochrome C domain-containing protein [Humisphaera sp.]